MENNNKNKMSKDPYKGVRDFYPEDMKIQRYIFDVMRKTTESFGYNEYNASILEPTELYKTKTSEEIINEQTYTFIDRGGREVTLRPEMTPTVARMIAKKRRELSSPIRWYSIPNMFRYEKPQKGRLREHWQLNVDVFGVKSIKADAEIISMASSLMKNFGAKESDFEIRINNRKLINEINSKILNLNEEESKILTRLTDRSGKNGRDEFEAQLSVLLGEKSKVYLDIINSKNIEELEKISEEISKLGGLKEIQELIKLLNSYGIKNVVYSPLLMRGFDYYTGIIFEIFDTNLENNRSMFGGGRYDDILDIFEEEKIPAVGFGMGDVTIQNFLESRNLLPEFKPTSSLYICTISPDFIDEANKIASDLRDRGLNVEIDITEKKVADQMKTANKKGIPFVVCIGEDEIKIGKFNIKNMKTGDTKEVNLDQIIALIQS